nr:hypothetical protein [Nitrososphaeria archaeon]
MSKKKKNSKMITVSVTEDALKEIKKMLWATDVCGQLLPDLHASNAFAVGCMAAMERDYEGIYFDLVDGSIKVMAMFPLD